MNSTYNRTFDFKQAVAKQFAGRPSLRQVASEELLKVMLVELPWLADVTPALSTGEPLVLDSPDPDTPHWTTQPLLERVLQALLDPELLSIEPLADGRHYNLGLTGAYRFPGSRNELDTRRLEGLSHALNELVACLPQRFAEAQLRYWAAEGSSGVSRDRWLQLLLKTALLRGLPLQGLDKQEQACIRGLIRAGADQPPVFFVQAQLTRAGLQYDEPLCHLLVLGEWDERQVVLWCAPSGVVRSFASLAAFGDALRDELAQRYTFEQMSWQRYPVEGNVFALQVSLLLETLFHRVDQVRCSGLKDIAHLEQRFAQLSDLSSWFVSYDNDTPAVGLPLGLRASTAQDSFAWCAALLQIAVCQLDSDGVAALDGVQSLQAFTRQQLAEQISQDYADDVSPDDLLLDLYQAQGVPGGAATGTGGGEPLTFAGRKSLCEFAIGNLTSLKGASIEQVHRRDGSPAPSWLTADVARQLVAKVDIGGHYPNYVATQLDDPATRADRVKRFALEWRSAMLASAVTAKLDRKVSEAGLQCVVDFCAGHVDPETPRMTLLPLAFKRSSTSRLSDQVRGMYILFCAEPSLVLLYRPLFRQDTLREYASLAALLEHVRTSPLLQTSIVDWMDPQVRSIYQNGGFKEPHIAVIGIDFYTAPATPEPASLAIGYWRNNLDERFYKANRDLLVELADEQSVSNAENRWRTLGEGAWLLFDVVTLLIRGPVASVAWLVQLLGALENDLQALEQGDEFGRSAAVVDLMLNIGMALLHTGKKGEAPTLHELPGADAFEGPGAQRGAFAEITVAPVQTTVAADAALPGRWQDLAWRGQNGFNFYSSAQRKALRAMRSSVSLDGLEPLSRGPAAGSYRIDDKYYVAIAGDVYQVGRLQVGMLIVGPDGTLGPRLKLENGAWRVDSGLANFGGMNQSATSGWLAKRFQKLHEKINELDKRAISARQAFGEKAKSSLKTKKELQTLKNLRETAAAKLASLPQGDAAAQMQDLLKLYDERIAKKEQDSLQAIDLSIQELEAAVRAEQELLPLLASLNEPKYASERQKGSWDAILPQHETNVREGLIRDTDFVITELWNLVDYPQLVEMQKALDGRPIAEVSELYRQFRRRLGIVVDLQARILQGFEQLDHVLAGTDAGLAITSVAGKPPATVAQLIASRSVSTVQLRFHQVMNLADLTLHLDSETGQETLAGYREELASQSLRNAADAHGELDFANLPAQDRIVILQEAWDEYSAALFNSDRILNEGSELIEPAMLERYREQLGKLKLDAGSRLVEAVREQDEGIVPVRHSPYQVSSKKQKVVRNKQGQLLIGTEIEGEPLLEVREGVSNVLLATFEKVGGEWQERVEEQPSPAEASSPGDLAMWVQSLLDDGKALRLKAESYVANDIKDSVLIGLFDRQLRKLDQAASTVGDAGGNNALLKTLEKEADELRTDKRLKLTRLYTDTNYPSAEALAFLHAENLIEVVYNERRTMQNNSAFDEYKVLRLPGKRNLWAAHFHLASPSAVATDFVVGHLKTWSQRRMSNYQAAQAGQRLHRGKLTLEQAQGIIPFQ